MVFLRKKRRVLRNRQNEIIQRLIDDGDSIPSEIPDQDFSGPVPVRDSFGQNPLGDSLVSMHQIDLVAPMPNSIGQRLERDSFDPIPSPRDMILQLMIEEGLIRDMMQYEQFTNFDGLKRIQFEQVRQRIEDDI